MSNDNSLINKIPEPFQSKVGWPWTQETDPSVYDSNVDWPKISIVTPSFNQGQFIEETIRSVLLQNYPNLEYIIIDGSSTDRTIDIIKKYEPWLADWVSEKDNGQSHAINKGYEKATGVIINWLNSDDLLVQNSLFFIASCFIVDPSLEWITGFRMVRNINNVGLKFENHWEHRWVHYTMGIPDFPQEATFMRKSLVDKIGEIDEGFNYLMDIDFYYRMLKHSKKGGFLRIVLSIMNEYNEQKTLKIDPNKAVEYLEIVKRHEYQLWLKIFLRLLRTRFHHISIKMAEILLIRKARGFYKIFTYSSEKASIEMKPFLTNTYNP